MSKQVSTEVKPQEVAISKTKQAITTFESQLTNYEKKVLPNLLEKHGISPAQFVQVVLSEIKKNQFLSNSFKFYPWK
jgi:hypothetical protein